MSYPNQARESLERRRLQKVKVKERAVYRGDYGNDKRWWCSYWLNVVIPPPGHRKTRGQEGVVKRSHRSEHQLCWSGAGKFLCGQAWRFSGNRKEKLLSAIFNLEQRSRNNFNRSFFLTMEISFPLLTGLPHIFVYHLFITHATLNIQISYLFCRHTSRFSIYFYFVI